MPAAKRSSPCGFTLIELMLVLILMGILTGSAVVALQGRDRPEALRLAAEDLAVAVGSAAEAAKRTGRPHVLVWEPEHRGYRLDAATGGATGRAGEETTEPVPGRAGRLHQLPEGVNPLPADPLESESGLVPSPELDRAQGVLGSAGLRSVLARFVPGENPAIRIGLVNEDGDQRWILRGAGLGQVRIEHIPAAANAVAEAAGQSQELQP